MVGAILLAAPLPSARATPDETGLASTDPLSLSAEELAEEYESEFDYLVREYDLDAEDAAHALRLTWIAGGVRQWATTAIAGYAGTWLDYTQPAVFIGVSGGSQRLAAARREVNDAFRGQAERPVVVERDLPMAALADAAQALHDVMAPSSANDDAIQVMIDEEAGELLVEGVAFAPSAVAQQVDALVTTSGFPVVRWQQADVASPAALDGGWDDGSCTVAFTVVNPANSRAVLSAGHCSDGWISHDGVVLSGAQFQRSFWPWLGGAADSGYDRQLHVVPAGNTTTAVLEGPNVTISGTFVPAQGSVICRYGAASVSHGQPTSFCSTVTGFGYDGFLAMATGCIYGDSGGPSWVMGKAVGIASITTDPEWPVSSESTCYQALVKDQLNGTGYFVQDAATGAGSDFQAMGLFHSVGPVRVLDTRGGSGVSGEITVPLNGALNYADLGAAVLSVTALKRTAPGNVSVYAGDNGFVPTTSSVNYTNSSPVESNLVISRVNRYTRTVKVNSTQNIDLLVDVIGYFSDTSGTIGAGGGVRSVALTAARVYDSRPNDLLLSGTSRDIQVRGLGGVPATATSVIVNITVVAPTATGNIAAHAGGTPPPSTSNLNFSAGQTKARLAVVPLDAMGRIRLTAGGPSSEFVIVDVQGYMEPTGTQNAGRTFAADGGGGRIVDTRSGAPLAAGSSVCTDVYSYRNEAGNGLPREGLSGVWLNVTVAGASGPGNLVVSAAGTSPTTSNLNYTSDGARSNAVFVRVPSTTDGTVCFTANNAGVHVIADVVAMTQG
ncbi:MAG: hypothetical protein Q7V88_05610 [Actinomycetota bacterium]|nr:hypothetical protein [Actinomycetota bacterium]